MCGWLCPRFGQRAARAASGWLREVIRAAEGAKAGSFRFAYESGLSSSRKWKSLPVKFTGQMVWTLHRLFKGIKEAGAFGLGSLPVCMAKTQYSLSDDPKKLGRPTGFRITVRNVKASAGAGFVVALTGDIMTMPGLPKAPAAEKIDVDPAGVISGLF